MLLKIHTCNDRGRCSCKAYPLVSLEDFKHVLTLRQQIALQRELTLTNISSARNFAELCALVVEYVGLPSNEDRIDHPESAFMTGVMIWATRISAGEDITLLDAIDVRLEQLEWYREPGDQEEDEGEQSPGKPSPAASAAAVARPAPAHRASGKRATSKRSKKR